MTASGRRFRAPAALAAGLTIALACVAAAAAPTAGKGVGLSRCLDLADRNHPNVLAARANLRRVRAQLDEAHFAPFSQFKLTGGVSLAPTVRGSSVFSPNTDASLTSSLGVAWRVTLDGVVPLWTFGKVTNLWQAADANVKLNEAGLDATRDAVRFDVRKAFYGLQLAREGLYLLGEARKKIAGALDSLQKKVDDDDADPVDLLKLRTYSAELDARQSEAEKFERVALAGLRFYTGVTNLDIVDEPMQAAKHKLGRLARYLGAARVHRPEVLMARAGVAARKAQLGLDRSRMFPDIGLGLSAGLSAAPEVADQINPYVNDPGNYFHYGLALVFQWKLDFAPGWFRVKQAEAQLEEMLAVDKKALGGVAAEVEEAYAEAVDYQKRMDAYTKATKYARKWLVMVQQAIDIGTREEKELIEPAKVWAQHRYNALEATMKYNLAICKLAKVTGWDAIAPTR